MGLLGGFVDLADLAMETPRPLLGRYSVLETIADSPERRVVLAEDLLRSRRRCALKIFRLGDGASLDEARRVFQALRRLRHPGIAEVYDFGRLDGREIVRAGLAPLDRPLARRASEPSPDDSADGVVPDLLAYMTSVFHLGVNFRDAFLLLFRTRSPDDPGAWRIFLEALARTCDALEAIHASGLIHYDIKLDNLLFIPEPSAARLERLGVKILDFGLSERAGNPIGTRLRGTIPFLAPEILESASADRRSDLFSLGVTAAFAVAGRVPFAGSTPREWLDAARAGRHIPLQKLCPAAPAVLCDVVGRLLDPDPDGRPPTARSLVPILESAGGFRLPPARQPLPPGGPVTGRSNEIARIRTEVEGMKRGESGACLILVEGDAEQYLDRFADEVEAVSRLEGVRAVGGRCAVLRQCAYQPFPEIIDLLLEQVDIGEPRFARFLPVLSRFCPQANRAAAQGTAALPPLRFRLEVSRFLDLVTEFILEVAREVPIVLCLRELQFAGRETLDLLRSIARNVHLSARGREAGDDEAAERPRLLLVATVRGLDAETDEGAAAPSSILQGFDAAGDAQVLRLQLRDFALEDLTGWLRERLPHVRIDGEMLRRLHEKCGGSEAFLEELVHRLPRVGVDAGETALQAPPGAAVAVAEPPRVAIQALPHALLSLPRRAVDAAMERVELLPRADRRILEILAVAGGTLRLAALARLLEEAGAAGETAPPGEASAARPDLLESGVQRLEDRGFVEIRDEPWGHRVTMPLPHLAREISLQIREDERQAIHRAIAISGVGSEECLVRVPEDVAHHALEGGLVDLFVERALVAAERLAAADALESAAGLYEKALEQLDGDATAARGAGGREALRRSIQQQLSEIYRELGQLQKALEKLTVLSSDQDVASDAAQLGSVYRRMGEVFQLSGETPNAAHFLGKSCRLLRREIDEPSPRPASESRQVSEEYLRGLLGMARVHASRDNLALATETLEQLIASAGDHAETACQANLLLAEIRHKGGLHGESLGSYLRALSIAREHGSAPLLLEALRAIGTSHSDQGQYDRASELFEEALGVARDLESKLEVAACHRSLGTVYHNRGDHERALEHFRRSLALSSLVGDTKGIAGSYNNLGIVYRFKDDLPRAGECYRLSIDLFSRVNDQQGMAAGMNNLATILELEGKYDEALEYSFRALDKRKKTRFRPGMGFSYYGIGKIYQSKGEIDKAASYAEKSLQIRRELGDKLGQAYSSLLLGELALAQQKYGEAIGLCRQALEDFERIGNEVGILMARANLARSLSAIGDLEEARRTLEDVLARAGKSGQSLLVGSCLLSLGLVASELGNPEEAEARLLEAEKLFRASKAPRDMVQVLLASAGVALDAGRLDRCGAALEEAYSILEELGIRDLVPQYFLLRGRLEMESSPGELESAKNFLERGLVETRETALPELRARFHHSLGILEVRRGDPRLAGIHFEEARAILEAFHKTFPDDLRKRFYRLREREAIRTGPSTFPGSSPEGKPPTEDPQGPDRAETAAAESGRLGEALAVQKHTLKLHEVAAAMGSEADLKKLLETVLDAVVALVDAERGFLILKGTKGGGRSITVARNLDREDIMTPEQKVSDSVARQVLRTGKPTLVRNAIEDSRFLSSKSIRNLRLRSLICVPLRFRGQTLGIIYLDNRHRRDAFSEPQLDMLQAFADQAAVAVTNARLIEENRRRNAELRKANRTMEALNLRLRRQVQKRTIELATVKDDLRQRQSQLEARYDFHRIIGKSDAMQEVFYLLEKVFPTTLAVLIEGESGTGKDLIAKAIHFNSPRRAGRFVSESCGALTESLFETELFGHERGAFTGAVSEKKGLMEMADGGTLFLDEVEDLTPSMQQKLVRVLEDGEVRRVGGKDSRRVSVRLISTSSRDLADLVARGLFRGDLYYRLNGIKVRLPSLRERGEDIPILVDHFVREAAETSGIQPRAFHPAALRALMDHEWRGNVRELRHLVERTLIVAPGPLIRKEDLVFDPATSPAEAALAPGAGPSGRSGRRRGEATMESADSLRGVRETAERQFVLWCLEESGGNVTAAARRCRVSRESFYRLLRKHGVRGAR